MAKRKKEKTGRVILVSKEDNRLLKQYFIEAENLGVTLTNSEICDQMFSLGLHTTIKNLRDGKN
jgi:hypothetical protein